MINSPHRVSIRNDTFPDEYCNGISGKICPVAEMQGSGPGELIVERCWISGASLSAKLTYFL